MKKILIVRLTALGDIVNSSIVIQLINRHFDNIQIDWLCEDINKELASSIIGISNVHTISLKKLKKSRSFSELKKTINYLKNLPTYDVVIDMQGLLKSAIVSRLVSSQTYGYDKNSSRESLSSLFYKHQFTKSYESNVIERNIFLTCSALKCNIKSDDTTNKEPIFHVDNSFTCSTLLREKKNIAIVIGASWESKKYPLDKFIELIDSNLNYNFLILSGNESEYNDAKYIASKSPSTALKPSSIKNLISLISKVDLVIGNDTGPTHIAWAQNISSITLFGPTNERMICQSSKNLFIKSPSHVNINKINKNDFTIKDIKAEEISHMIEQLL